MSLTSPPFPTAMPKDYRALADEPAFDPVRHLALEAPLQAWTLADFGYDDAVAAVQAVCRALREERRMEAGQRTSSYVPGAVYRSQFLRDLCNAPEIAAFLSGIAGTQLLPHSMPSQQVYINFAPDDLSKAVDNWHVDSIGFDYVLMASDPAMLSGGRFEFFRGTLDQAGALLDTTPAMLTEGFGDDLPLDLVETVMFPGPGYAIFQQGHLVLHRATRLYEPAERITLVPGYVAADTATDDPTKVERITTWGETGILAELARHAAWRSRARLDQLIDQLPLDDDPRAIVGALEDATADLDRLIARLKEQYEG